MKITKTASGKTKILMSKSEWQSIGKTAGWFDTPDMEKFQPSEQPEKGSEREIMDLTKYIRRFLLTEFPNLEKPISRDTKDMIRKSIFNLKDKLSGQGYDWVNVGLAADEVCQSMGIYLHQY